MSTCIPDGWGTGPYGMTPWGGSLGSIPGGPLPIVDPFDIYCVGPCGPMSSLLTYSEVSIVGDGTQLFVDDGLDQNILSGGGATSSDARILIETSVPPTLTFEFTVNFRTLPTDFSSLVARHIGISITDAAGPCVALFFSRTGIGYAGGFHHDGSGNLVLDSTFQLLPGSQVSVSENEHWTYRIAADLSVGVVYIYITKTADLVAVGHQLRYIMPVIPSSALATPTTDRTTISVRGTAGSPSWLALDSICLGSRFIIPNAPPIADAGLDQAARTCSIVQLDGSRSFDPEGAVVAYKWRLLDAPLGSMSMFDGVDGRTFDMGSDATNKFYAASLAALDTVDPIITTGISDVLVLAGEAYDIIGKGTDGDGFFVQVDGFVLPDDLFNATFKLLRQRGISGPTTSKPTFFPDLAGLYKFDLVVFDGGLFSVPSVTIVNITESPVPRGCIPDVRFLWGYLSDFWRLVEEKERIETFWSASAQVAASELLSLWQIDYSKSLRDVQRTFQRRWLNYELVVAEPFPELTSTRLLFGGLRQIFPVAGIAAIPGTTITFTIPFFDSAGTSQVSSSYTFTGSGNLTAQQVADQLGPHLTLLDGRFSISVVPNRLGTQVELRINAPFSFHTEASDTAPIFVAPNSSAQFSGIGAGVGVMTYKVDRTLRGIDVREGDIIGVGDIAYRVRGLTDDPGDEWPFQRITLLSELPTAAATTWALVGKVTSKVLNFYESLIDTKDLVFFEVFDRQTQVTTLVRLQGAWAPSGAIGEFGVEGLGVLANYLLHPTRKYAVHFKSATRLTRLPIDALVVDIPYLQEKIRSTDDTAVLRRNIDFYLETFRGKNSIRFVFDGFGLLNDVWESADTVPVRLWAETTYFDNRPVIEQNFGIPVAFDLDDLAQLPSNVDYLSAVRGLWYSYFNGPTVNNLRVGTQILLGLPFAEEAGTIQEIRSDFSPNSGRILVSDRANPEIVRSYTYPVSLLLEVNPATGGVYKVGDRVEQFAPLITGVEVVDWVKDPDWFAGYLQQGNFYEIEKYFKFLVRVDSAAFNLAALLFVQSFILRIKPTYTYPLFIVRQRIGFDGSTEVSTTDDIHYSGVLSLFDGACSQLNGEGTFGAATMIDEPDPSGGGWQNKLDTDSDPSTGAPTYPTSQPTSWGLDRELMCPEDYILASCCHVYAVPALPVLDSIFVIDAEVSSSNFAIFEDSWVTNVPTTASGGLLFPDELVVALDGTITDIKVSIEGDFGTTTAQFQLILYVAGVAQTPIIFTQSSNPFEFHAVVSIPVVTGDTLALQLLTVSGASASPNWKGIKAEFGIMGPWALDTELPAGTYCNYKVL